MRGVLVNAAVVAVFAAGGLPALAMTLTDDEPADVAPTEITDRHGDQGPPPWARANGHGPKHQGKHGSLDDAARRDGDRTAPPGWKKAGDKTGEKRGWKGKDVPPGWAKHGWTEPPGQSKRS
jgi:hypothetical protein